MKKALCRRYRACTHCLNPLHRPERSGIYSVCCGSLAHACLVGFLAGQFLGCQGIAVTADAFLDPHVRPVAVGDFIRPPFVPELMVQEPVEVFASFFLVPVFVCRRRYWSGVPYPGAGVSDAAMRSLTQGDIHQNTFHGCGRIVQRGRAVFPPCRNSLPVHNIPLVQYARRRWWVGSFGFTLYFPTIEHQAIIADGIIGFIVIG